jgi:ATP synthase protein I
VAVGGGLGYFADKAAGTSPFLLIVFLVLGGAAGIMNAIRVARDMQKAVERDNRDSR